MDEDQLAAVARIRTAQRADLARIDAETTPADYPDDVKDRVNAVLVRHGEAVRALAWLGPEKAGTALETLKRKLGPSAFGELVSVGPRLPTWLARSVSQAAHV